MVEQGASNVSGRGIWVRRAEGVRSGEKMIPQEKGKRAGRHRLHRALSQATTQLSVWSNGSQRKNLS